jgi:hypothetical protein
MNKEEALRIIGATIPLDSDISGVIDFENLIFLWRHSLENKDKKVLVKKRVMEVLSQTVNLSELIRFWNRSSASQLIRILVEERMVEVFSSVLPTINNCGELIPLWRHSPEKIKILIEKRILEIPE